MIFEVTSDKGNPLARPCDMAKIVEDKTGAKWIVELTSLEDLEHLLKSCPAVILKSEIDGQSTRSNEKYNHYMMVHKNTSPDGYECPADIPNEKYKSFILDDQW